jgi:hypothetical protein
VDYGQIPGKKVRLICGNAHESGRSGRDGDAARVRKQNGLDVSLEKVSAEYGRLTFVGGFGRIKMSRTKAN